MAAIQTGNHVYLRAYGGEVIQRRVVRVNGRTLEVTTDDEWENAEREGREPLTVGFNRAYVLRPPTRR